MSETQPTISNSTVLNSTTTSNPTLLTVQSNQTNSAYSMVVRITSQDVLDIIFELKQEIKELKCADVFANQPLTGLIYVNEFFQPTNINSVSVPVLRSNLRGMSLRGLSLVIFTCSDTTSDPISIFSENDLRSLPWLLKLAKIYSNTQSPDNFKVFNLNINSLR